MIHPKAIVEDLNAIGPGTNVWAFAHVMAGARVGSHCNLGDHAFVEAGSVIGNNVTLKNHVLVWNGITIEDDVFVGARSEVAEGVIVEEGAVLAMGCYVGASTRIYDAEQGKAIETGRADKTNNLLKNAPHTAEAVISDKWDRPYPREQAAFPVASLRRYKFWPAVGRIDNVFGDRNLVCSCIGMDAYQ